MKIILPLNLINIVFNGFLFGFRYSLNLKAMSVDETSGLFGWFRQWFVRAACSLKAGLTRCQSPHRQGMSERLLWLWLWGTRESLSLTPEMASSCALPDRLLSDPRRRLSAPPPTAELCPDCCWSRAAALGAVLVEVFFFVGPKPKNLK